MVYLSPILTYIILYPIYTVDTTYQISIVLTRLFHNIYSIATTKYLKDIFED